ncbi:hypothetical protein [Roseateles saccharophilus]|uniref:Uncharacterized protein n=1 Tax=Roseateles saccharophilus TaxID=304 RepID=A0A4R3VBD3_ROSSA|nr:hypothetical protein [Roseateles saccharophilus]MDG0835685.1 hypothetical protein [Roseateles saccharophilus]TCV01093.1 hypothetical protein EV671_100619 [Roseateles saccharophilus]
MADDDFTPQQPDTEAAPRGLWSTLSRWWASATTPAEAALGYESAQPWTLADVPDDGRPAGE